MRTLAALLLLISAAYAQPVCSVDGAVVNSVTGAPIVRARVTDNKDAFALTDESGKWTLNRIACGNVNINASRQTFISFPRTITVTTDAALHDVKLALAPQAVVMARVLDEHGDPIETARIAVLKSRVSNGARGFDYRLGGFTNDVGEFRIAGLAAGKYVFCATAGSAHEPRVQPYGERCSTLMTVFAGSSGNVDFQLEPLSRHHVRGLISGGQEGATPQLTLTGDSGAFSTSIRPDGSFDIENVPSGQYELAATLFQENDRLTAGTILEVGGNDLDGIQLHLDKGFEVTGDVRVVSAAGRKIDDARYVVSLTPYRGVPGQTVWNDDKTSFTIPEVAPGNYRLRFTVPEPFYLKSATSGGRDVTGSDFTVGPGMPGIEVTLMDVGGVVEGDVATDSGLAAASIVIQGEAPQHWYGRADASGHFKIEGIPPGDYRVSAWDDITNVEYADPAWMQLNGKAVATTVQAGQTTQVALTRKAAPGE